MGSFDYSSAAHIPTKRSAAAEQILKITGLRGAGLALDCVGVKLTTAARYTRPGN